MKFGKLLAAGKSWVGGNGVGRYQMRDGLALPKFISPRNPFKQEAAAGPIAPPSVAAAPAVNGALPVADAPVANVATGTASGAPARAKVSVKARLGAGVKQVALFFLDHNPFSAIGRPKLSGIPRFGKPAVQGELSLDKVKVVRSDLNHSDLEVVRLSAGSK